MKAYPLHDVYTYFWPPEGPWLHGPHFDFTIRPDSNIGKSANITNIRQPHVKSGIDRREMDVIHWPKINMIYSV